jgi:phenylacetic acid degradation operon negative regulatory protein
MPGVPPSARSLVLDLLATVRRGSVPVRALVEAGALFGLRENGIRVALARLLAEGAVLREGPGRYRLAGSALGDWVRSWRDLERRLRRWSGGWVGVGAAGLAGESARERRERARALRLLGFRPFAPGLDLRPDNRAGGVAALRLELVGLGLEPEAPVFAVRELSPRDERRARSLWDVPALLAGYRATRAALESSAARLPRLAPEAARVESFELGGAAIRQLLLDPLLPEPIAPEAERQALLEALRRYDALGRRAWRGWLGPGSGAEPAGVPAAVSGGRGARAPAELALGAEV